MRFGYGGAAAAKLRRPLEPLQSEYSTMRRAVIAVFLFVAGKWQGRTRDGKMLRIRTATLVAI
jgi:hypothetical protein